jgi:protein ImuB
MTRVISVFLPTLSTDRVRRKAADTVPPPETPLILIGRDGRRRVVLAADAAAQAAGLRVGMPATKAQALVQGLVIQDADPAGDAEALDRLALWMLRRFAPIIAADAPNGIVIDSTGADHLYGDETAMLAALLEKFGSVGLRVRAAIADSWGAAHALARFNARPGYVSEPGKAEGDVAPLPIAALRPIWLAASGSSASSTSATCWRNRARPSRSASVLSSAVDLTRRPAIPPNRSSPSVPSN